MEKKILRCVADLEITLILEFLSILFCKLVLKARDNIPRHGRTISNCFFSTVNAT